MGKTHTLKKSKNKLNKNKKYQKHAIKQSKRSKKSKKVKKVKLTQFGGLNPPVLVDESGRRYCEDPDKYEYVTNSDTCEEYLQPVVQNCQNGSTLINGKCELQYAEVMCPNGYPPINGECEPQYAEVMCPNGYPPINGQCESIYDEAYNHRCNNGRIVRNEKNCNTTGANNSHSPPITKVYRRSSSRQTLRERPEHLNPQGKNNSEA
jgi:hypothetical protein